MRDDLILHLDRRIEPKSAGRCPDSSSKPVEDVGERMPLQCGWREFTEGAKKMAPKVRENSLGQ